MQETKEEFTARVSREFNIPTDALVEHIQPCSCGLDTCKGWRLSQAGVDLVGLALAEEARFV